MYPTIGDRYMNVNLATIRHHRRQFVCVQTCKWKSKRGLTLRNDNYLGRHRTCQSGKMTRIDFELA